MIAAGGLAWTATYHPPMFETHSSPQCSCVEDFFQAHDFQRRIWFILPRGSRPADPKQVAVAPKRRPSDARAIRGHRVGTYRVCDRLDSFHSINHHGFVFPRSIVVASVPLFAKDDSVLDPSKRTVPPRARENTG